MPYIKIDPSGCCIHKGWIQVRVNMYLDPTDPRYSEHHVSVVDETSAKFLKGYIGKLNPDGTPVNQAQYDEWIASLPHVWRDNPFNNQFFHIDVGMTILELLSQVQAVFSEMFDGWSSGLNPDAIWKSKVRPKLTARALTPEQITAFETKLNQIKALVL